MQSSAQKPNKINIVKTLSLFDDFIINGSLSQNIPCDSYKQKIKKRPVFHLCLSVENGSLFLVLCENYAFGLLCVRALVFPSGLISPARISDRFVNAGPTSS